MARFLHLVLIVWAASLILYPLRFLLFGIPVSELDWLAAAVGSFVIVSAALTVVGIPVVALARSLGFDERQLIMTVIGGFLGIVASTVGIGAAYEDAFTKALDSAAFWIIYFGVLGALAAFIWHRIRAGKAASA